ncbi:MAG TPA: efflux RND transporter periplasmic adaptor subunit [Gemmatimonadales bacterium]|nr:efflux RND transporter periplasmic adaptor subunit [Gemmatimonadales bacterium]
MNARWSCAWLLVAVVVSAGGCGSKGGGDADDQPAAVPADTNAATPVRIAFARLDTLRVQVTAPGQTNVLREEHVRAPFSGVLTSLGVTDGDRVRAGEVLGTIVSLNSEAALDGARAMLASARTAADSADARRALTLARANQIERTITAPEAGVVLSHSASPGDRLAEGDDVVQLAAANSSIFIANVAQSDAVGVRAGQPVAIQLAATSTTIHGAVHGVLPAASSTAFTVPVRIDLGSALPVPSVGLFGTATITIGRKAGVLAVPTAAVLTDDITGTARVAVVHGGRARWVEVQKGVEDHGRIAVTGTSLAPGDTVIVSGQVGLPDSTRVRAQP